MANTTGLYKGSQSCQLSLIHFLCNFRNFSEVNKIFQFLELEAKEGICVSAVIMPVCFLAVKLYVCLEEVSTITPSMTKKSLFRVCRRKDISKTVIHRP